MAREARIIRELRRAGFTVLTRRQWGSRHLGIYQTRRRTRRFVGPADHLFGHITVTRATSDPRADMRTLENIGIARFGSGVSYNYALHRPTQTILIGMPHDAAGAHTLNDKNVPGFPFNLNYWGHATALIGMPGDRFDDWCVRAAAAIEDAEKKHGACKPRARWHPHSKFAWKECPCDSFRDAIPRIEATDPLILTTAPPLAPLPSPDTLKEYDEMALDDALNVHDPNGRRETQNITVRELLTAQAIELLQGRRAAKDYLKRAQKSAATRK